jgi:hypothetical protein
MSNLKEKCPNIDILLDNLFPGHKEYIVKWLADTFYSDKMLSVVPYSVGNSFEAKEVLYKDLLPYMFPGKSAYFGSYEVGLSYIPEEAMNYRLVIFNYIDKKVTKGSRLGKLILGDTIKVGAKNKRKSIVKKSFNVMMFADCIDSKRIKNTDIKTKTMVQRVILPEQLQDVFGRSVSKEEFRSMVLAEAEAFDKTLKEYV